MTQLIKQSWTSYQKFFFLLSHGEETLKYRQLVLDENTGI